MPTIREHIQKEVIDQIIDLDKLPQIVGLIQAVSDSTQLVKDTKEELSHSFENMEKSLKMAFD